MSVESQREPESVLPLGRQARAPTATSPLLTPPFVRLLGVQAAIGLASSIFALLPKVLAADDGATAREIGFVMAAFGIASLLAIPFVGRVVDGLGHARALVAAASLLAVTAVGFAFVDRAGALAVALRGAQGVSWSISFAAGMALVADLVPTARLAQGIGIFGAAALSMNAVGPALAEPLAERFGARAIFALATAASVVGAAFARRLPNATSHAHGAPLAGERVDFGAGGGLRVRVYLAFIVAGLCWSVMFTFIAPFALARGVHEVRGFFVAYTLTALAVRVFGARLADELGPARVAFGSSIAYGLMVVVAGLTGPAHLALVGGGFGLAHGGAFPSLMALLLGDAPPAARARIIALSNGAMNLGLAAVLVVGLLVEHVGYPPVFVFAGLCNVATAAILLPRRRARQGFMGA